MLEAIRRYVQLAGRFLEPKTPEERQKRSDHAFALLLVAVVASVKHLTGVTLHDAPFTLFTLAVAGSAAWGGLAPAFVATLAAILLGGLGTPAPRDLQAGLVFATEAVAVSLIVSAFRSRLQKEGARLDTAQARIAELKLQDADGRRGWADYREAATRAQDALQQAADEARQRLAALESLTDPSLNPLAGSSMVVELLERLRAALGAGGAALVRPGRGGAAVLAADGLQANPRPLGADILRLTPGRVTVVHNDRARVEEQSSLHWSEDVTSLLVVPVVHNGHVWSTIEVVSERSRQVSDWDVALVRIVADRLAAVVVQDGGLEAKAS